VTIFIATDYIPGPQDDACDVLLVLPKNTGLKRYASIFLDNHPHLASCKVITVRGEDVPFWVEQLTKKGKRAIGLTGEGPWVFSLKSSLSLSLRPSRGGS